jgi:hypothetical protein
MEIRNFDRIAASLAEPKNRRDAMRLAGALVLGAGSVSLLTTEGEAKRGKRRKNRNKNKKQKQETPPAPDPFVDIAITDILVEPTSETAHDNLVVQFVNNGTLAASGFRIGMTAKRTNGQIRNEVFSLPIATLAPGESASVEFRLGCNWLNSGTVTARTDPSPVTGEPGTETANNVRTVTFGATICS